MIETRRLRLRPWREADRAPNAAMLADPQVGYWLGATQTTEEADAGVDRAIAHFEAQGFGLLAIERKSDSEFLGAAGLLTLREGHPIGPGVEIGWRLARSAWGGGVATEAARALLEDGLTRLGLEQVVAFTAWSNLRSQAVMERLGMVRQPARDFDHPSLAEDHPLRPHVVYSARRSTPGAEASR
jgi:RimJ/RimL family protein N-acetyltransferase